ncbi:MAG: prolyl oligopeptidase family serine peptidase [Bacteroidales bacterium]|jgi:esterase/lipase
MKRIVSLLILTCFSFIANGQVWDNKSSGDWPVECKDVSIISSSDGKSQRAMFYPTEKSSPQPLIVSLHTWSGNYRQIDPLVVEIIRKGYNYIHPDFRGPNTNPDACCSDLTISDILDAIIYSINTANVEPTEVHIIGCSGGGYLTLMLYMRLNYPVKSFSAWVPVSDLEEWYWQCKGRNLHYSRQIMNATSSKEELNASEARKRSPIFQQFNEKLRKEVPLYIYAGIHDGYTGAVPVSQSVNMYNMLAYEISKKRAVLISDKEQLNLITNRSVAGYDKKPLIGEREILLHKKNGPVEIIIFEGTHELLTDCALSLIPIKK